MEMTPRWTSPVTAWVPMALAVARMGLSRPTREQTSPTVRRVTRTSGDGGGGVAFIVLVTESPPGPDNGNRASWGGVRAFFVRGTGAVLESTEGIPATSLADPVGLAFRASSSEVFVSNRHGNNSADGVAGSIARFAFDPQTRRLARGAITGNGLAGVHQAAFNPVSGELFAANVKGGISRFTFDAAGTAVAADNATGEARGVAVSPDGKRLYVSGATPVIRQIRVARRHRSRGGSPSADRTPSCTTSPAR